MVSSHRRMNDLLLLCVLAPNACMSSRNYWRKTFGCSSASWALSASPYLPDKIPKRATANIRVPRQQRIVQRTGDSTPSHIGRLLVLERQYLQNFCRETIGRCPRLSPRPSFWCFVTTYFISAACLEMLCDLHPLPTGWKGHLCSADRSGHLYSCMRLVLLHSHFVVFKTAAIDPCLGWCANLDTQTRLVPRVGMCARCPVSCSAPMTMLQQQLAQVSVCIVGPLPVLAMLGCECLCMSYLCTRRICLLSSRLS